ncbi:MAG TPA: PBP1A family penicillin-binding protein [Polyangiaceae bacterium]|nr:PBP1A family penicillin-binding protein [Polyangiaceae bacterium]
MERDEALRLLKKGAKYGGLGIGAATLVGAGAVFATIHHYEANLPSVEQLKTGYRPPQVTRVLARDGSLLGSLFTERRTVIAFADLPPHVKLSFLAAEDASFYEHQGLNYFGMLRALLANLRAHGTRQGASTITQQVVKNLLLTPERTYERKVKETILAKRLEQELSKDEIFSLYLNHIYLGHGRYGVEEAARYYFGKKARELDLAESALLAGLVAAPERFSPRVDAEKALGRRRYVLKQLVEKGFVTRELYDQASAEPLRLAPGADEESELCPEIVAYARRTLKSVAGDAADKGGYTVTTTIDPRLQAAARKALRDGLGAYASRQKLEPPLTLGTRRLWGPAFSGTPQPNNIYIGRVRSLDDEKNTIDVEIGDAVGRVALAREGRYNPKHLSPSAFTKVGALLRVSLLSAVEHGQAAVPLRLELGPEGALVAVDVRSRDVLALVGNEEAVAGGLDRATQAHRQPGSSFKPFLYGYALASRRLTTSSVLDIPGTPAKNGKPAKEARRLSLRKAIAQSDNDAAELLLSTVGAPNVIEWARSLGIESRMEPTRSLALGAYEVYPLEIVAAYAAFASGGEVAPPRLIRKIVGPDGKELSLPSAPPSRRAISAEEAYLVTSLLRGVVESGTAKRAASLGRPLAGKTGTTNLAKDCWFIGYSTEIVAGAWVGYDNPMPLGWGESGATTSLPIWMSFMKAAHEGRPATDFPRPSGIVTASIDPATGLLAYPGQTDAIEEEFLDGTVPNETAKPPEAPTSPAAGVDDEANEGRTVAAPTPDPPAPKPNVPAAATAGGATEPPPF